MLNPSIIQSQQRSALNPLSIQIDGRSEMDRLSFIVRFAHLVNFYDKTNEHHGSWAPFLLKDPLILLAYVAKTPYNEYYKSYKRICSSIETTTSPEEQSYFFNKLFELIEKVFDKIAEWMHFMIKDLNHYDLKTFVIQEVKEVYSQHLWSIVELQQRLSISTKIKNIEPFDKSRIKHLNDYWKKENSTIPYFEEFGLNKNLRGNDTIQIFNGLKKISDEVIGFFIRIAKNAKTYFHKIANKVDTFPDTTLVKAFVKLLNFLQPNLNDLGKEHLDFYYKDVLKQSAKGAMPDCAHLCLELKSKIPFYTLDKGVEFNAGVDANKQAITYSTLGKTVLNAAKIDSVFQLSIDVDQQQLFFNQIKKATTVQKDAEGKPSAWTTFNANTGTNTAVSFGFAIASPMLLLEDGLRTINFTITQEDGKVFTKQDKVKFYLSTTKTWLDVTEKITEQTGVSWQIKLESTDLAIVPFKKNPDHLTAEWPLLKVLFESTEFLLSPPSIKEVQIDVDVQGTTQYVMYNDSAKINPKKPFQLLGAIPEVHSNFYIGSQEIFSKPVNYLQVDLTWSNLPENFYDSYEEYNQYHEDPTILSASQSNSGATKSSPPKNKFFGFLNSIADPFEKWLKIKTASHWLTKGLKSVLGFIFNIGAEDLIENAGLFKNNSFKVDFELLNDNAWSSIKAQGEDEKSQTLTLFTKDGGNSLDLAEEQTLVFGVKKEDEFPNPIIQGDAQLQKSPLTYNEHTNEGFIKMTLETPDQGFGNEMYPKVVTYVALNNAEVISRKKDPSLLMSAPNPPFVPTVSATSVSYQASKKYEIGSPNPNFQYFNYGPFENYEVQFESNKAGNLVQAFNAKGAIYISLSSLSVNTPLSIFFEVHGGLPGNFNNEIEYQYLSTEEIENQDGIVFNKDVWKELSVLNDTTNQFRCSGIITFNVPGDISKNHNTMPSKKFWISISVKNDPANYGDTIYLNSNGVLVNRSSAILKNQDLVLAADTIQSPLIPIPEINKTLQPFASNGGVLPEDKTQMINRVSNRILNKDRCRNALDYYTLVCQAFPEIFYLQTNNSGQGLSVFLVKKYDTWQVSGAFDPHVSACALDHIFSFFKSKTSPFTRLQVQNMPHKKLSVSCDFVFSEGTVRGGVIQKINQGINIYLSPWIGSLQEQRTIGEPIRIAQLKKFISQFEGVESVSNLKLNNGQSDIINPDRTVLYVSSMQHHFND